MFHYFNHSFSWSSVAHSSLIPKSIILVYSTYWFRVALMVTSLHALFVLTSTDHVVHYRRVLYLLYNFLTHAAVHNSNHPTCHSKCKTGILTNIVAHILVEESNAMGRSEHNPKRWHDLLKQRNETLHSCNKVDCEDLAITNDWEVVVGDRFPGFQ